MAGAASEYTWRGETGTDPRSSGGLYSSFRC